MSTHSNIKHKNSKKYRNNSPPRLDYSFSDRPQNEDLTEPDIFSKSPYDNVDQDDSIEFPSDQDILSASQKFPNKKLSFHNKSSEIENFSFHKKDSDSFEQINEFSQKDQSSGSEAHSDDDKQLIVDKNRIAKPLQDNSHIKNSQMNTKIKFNPKEKPISVPAFFEPEEYRVFISQSNDISTLNNNEKKLKTVRKPKPLNHKQIQPQIKRDSTRDTSTNHQPNDNSNSKKNLTQQKESKKAKEPIHLSDGSIYEGEWLGAIKSGMGKLIYPDGTIYVGEFKEDKPNGQGKWVDSNKNEYYEGGFVNGLRNGFGIFASSSLRYEGDWQNNMQNGKGIETSDNGNKYEGSFVLGKKHGKGKYTFANSDIYEGDFVENKIYGFGTYKFKDGNEYEGEWKNQMLDGKGKLKYKDGRVYVGDFIKDKRQGKGILTWSDGKSYEGEWLDDKMHGIGKFTQNGVTREGVFENNKLVQKLDGGSSSSSVNQSPSTLNKSQNSERF